MTGRMALMVWIALLASGCSLLTDPIADVEKQIGAPVQVVATAEGPDGPIHFFTFRNGDRCGSGHASARHGSSWAIEPCSPTAKEPLTIRDLTVKAPAGKPGLIILMGDVRDPAIQRVAVRMGGQEHEATLEGGVWHLVAEPPAGRGAIDGVVGYDGSGERIAEIQSPSP